MVRSPQDSQFLIIVTGIATSSMIVPHWGGGKFSDSAGPGVKIVGTKATLTIPPGIYRPTEYTIHSFAEGSRPERHVVEIPGKGMHWQADATARAIRKSSALDIFDM